MPQGQPTKTYRVTWDELMSRQSEIAPDAVLEVHVYEPESLPRADKENQALLDLLRSWRAADQTNDLGELERRDAETKALMANIGASRVSLREQEA